jgi:myo-inositol-hexaphosphate 3-phosphohydrolase
VYQLDGTFVEDFGQAHFGADSDVDGLVLYRCGSDGYLIASDQKLHQFEVFDRLTRDHLATFSIANAQKTIGIAIAQGSVPGFPNGAMFVQSDDRQVLGVQWDALAAATGASTCALPD